jgi:YegS/Rv2252/BmrU family lipid kinase
MKKIRIILNGKGAANPQVRAAIFQIRDDGQPLEVNCTWEGDDASRFAREAMNDGVEVLVAGGGDGTINEVVNGILSTDSSPKMALGVLPLGTANDFARGCGIPLEPFEALKLATEGEPVSIDIPSANGVYFANVASGGFGAEVTVGTNPQLKKAMGGGAYALTPGRRRIPGHTKRLPRRWAHGCHGPLRLSDQRTGSGDQRVSRLCQS